MARLSRPVSFINTPACRRLVRICVRPFALIGKKFFEGVRRQSDRVGVADLFNIDRDQFAPARATRWIVQQEVNAITLPRTIANHVIPRKEIFTHDGVAVEQAKEAVVVFLIEEFDDAFQWLPRINFPEWK